MQGLMTPNQWIEQWCQRFWNESQAATITEMIAADGVFSGLPGGPYRGHDEIGAFYQSKTSIFGEFDVEVNEAMEWGDEGMARCHLNMTHTASGHRVGLEFACWYRLRDGLLVEGRHYIDFLALLQQLGRSSRDAFQEAIR